MPTKNELSYDSRGDLRYAGAVMPARKEMTIQDLWGILSRRRRIVLGVLLLTIAVAGALFATATRLYKASAEIQVQKECGRCVEHEHHDGPRNGVGCG